MTNTATAHITRILGTTDTAPTNACEYCGLPELKTYVVAEMSFGPDLHLGTTCAAKLARRGAAEIRKEAKAADKATADAARIARRNEANEEFARFAEFVLSTYGGDNYADTIRRVGVAAARDAYEVA